MVEQRRRAVFNWSGGKDSALALQTVLREDRYEVVSLLTTVDASNDRSSMHGIPAELLRMQADSIGLPIRIVPTGKGIEDYERAMAEAVGDFVARGAEHFIFGDIFLQDVRAYRERQLEAVWRDGGRAAVGTGAGTDYGRFSRLGTRNGRCNDRCFLPRCRLDRADDRRNVSRRFARRCRSVRRERRISYVLPCGGMFRYPIPFRLGGPVRRSYTVTLEDGAVKSYAYWFAALTTP